MQEKCKATDARGAVVAAVLGQKGRGSGYLAKPKTTKVGLCRELESNVFHYEGYNAANTMRVTQDKIQQYVGIKCGKDIANKICNKVTVVLRPPQ
jgi:hypothetical protein